ncbi:Sulfatase domain containing protein [Metarhizium acridum CQMa 102]|uniref:Sulfatase domain containing protein n=1 Tax=Metarhizium acridum (strain CQMa 102) TaxID=655827 RepID=E9DZA6_METAQ|nr:Sulfatase domain containing protein [Metarhizium acridum CQMa 102]EFY91068.1 Sulfatase domain containing protein [Metarhizium acridum CQMa 102]
MYPPLVCFLFAIFFVSVSTTKLLSLSLNAHVFPTGVFVFCLPTFIVPDIVLITLIWILLRRRNGLFALLGFCLACLICFAPASALRYANGCPPLRIVCSLVTLGAASSQLGFFYQTGGEIDWGDATTFAFSEEGRKVLLSEGKTPLAFTCVILVVSWLVKFRLCKFVSSALAAVEIYAQSVIRWTASKVGLCKLAKADNESSLLPTQEYEFDSDSESSCDGPPDTTRRRLGKTGSATTRAMHCPGFIPWSYGIMALSGFLAILILFDPERPYGRMFTTLPLPLLAVFAPKSIECTSSSWPLPDLIDSSNWESPRGNFRGWAPGAANEIIQQYRDRKPDWLPSELPQGFGRWSVEARTGDVNELLKNATGHRDSKCPDPLVLDPYYNPANDPMKISNLENPVLKPLEGMLQGGSVKIKHIAVILMESMREELFPLQQGSGFHDLIMKSHDELDHDDINELLSHISPNTERITGRSGNWRSKNGTAFGRKYSEWNDKTEDGFGGLHVVGGLTTSSVSTKSLAAVHCGAWPIPVDMFEEAETECYQPCLPEILELFNRLKKNTTTSDNYHEQQWYPAFFQAVTDGYDRQDKFDSKIGFKHIVNKNRIKQDSESNPELEEINYFGFPETALKTYVTDYITNATANNQRMFLSHFTSTTHHPWAVPKWFNSSEYMGSAHGLMQTHKDLNSYLNTIRFNDAWIGQLMQIFDDQGISDETLVIFVGDHGQAFKEDFGKTGTYENSHISNFRVPITFRHPKLPRVEHRVNATSLSILPTILDLLVNTGSLNKRDAAAAADLVQDYEGQSLIRPFETTRKGRRAWNYGLVNPGGRMLTITSSDTPWRLVLPLDKKTEYVFSDLGRDPMERNRVLEWSINSLASTVRGKYGDGAADWLIEADKVGLWWAAERKRLWNYNPSS